MATLISTRTAKIERASWLDLWKLNLITGIPVIEIVKRIR